MNFRSLVAVATAAVFAASAHANSNVEVSVNNFSVTSTGAFSWIDQSNGLGVRAADQLGWATTTSPQWGDWTDNYAYSGTSAVTTAGGTFATLTLGASGFNAKLFTSGTGGKAEADIDLVYDFSLAANSSVTFEWDRTIYGINHGQTGANTIYDYTNEMVVNTSGMVADEWHGFTPIYGVQSTLDPAPFVMDGGTVHQSITFTNNSMNAITSTFRASVQVYSEGVVAAVPEPASLALLMAGLGSVGFLIQRRRG